jgi:hypothetical protein
MRPAPSAADLRDLARFLELNRGTLAKHIRRGSVRAFESAPGLAARIADAAEILSRLADVRPFDHSRESDTRNARGDVQADPDRDILPGESIGDRVRRAMAEGNPRT